MPSQLINAKATTVESIPGAHNCALLSAALALPVPKGQQLLSRVMSIHLIYLLQKGVMEHSSSLAVHVFTIRMLSPVIVIILQGLFEVGAGLGYSLGPPLGGFLYAV